MNECNLQDVFDLVIVSFIHRSDVQWQNILITLKQMQMLNWHKGRTQVRIIHVRFFFFFLIFAKKIQKICMNIIQKRIECTQTRTKPYENRLKKPTALQLMMTLYCYVHSIHEARSICYHLLTKRNSFVFFFLILLSSDVFRLLFDTIFIPFVLAGVCVFVFVDVCKIHK